MTNTLPDNLYLTDKHKFYENKICSSGNYHSGAHASIVILIQDSYFVLSLHKVLLKLHESIVKLEKRVETFKPDMQSFRPSISCGLYFTTKHLPSYMS